LSKEKRKLEEKIESKANEIIRLEIENNDLKTENSYIKNDVSTKDSTITYLEDDLNETKTKLMKD